jgi:hypothetical protein
VVHDLAVRVVPRGARTGRAPSMTNLLVRACSLLSAFVVTAFVVTAFVVTAFVVTAFVVTVFVVTAFVVTVFVVTVFVHSAGLRGVVSPVGR